MNISGFKLCCCKSSQFHLFLGLCLCIAFNHTKCSVYTLRLFHSLCLDATLRTFFCFEKSYVSGDLTPRNKPQQNLDHLHTLIYFCHVEDLTEPSSKKLKHFCALLLKRDCNSAPKSCTYLKLTPPKSSVLLFN